MVSSGKEVMRSMNVKPTKQKVRKEASDWNVSVCCAINSMLTKILDPLGTLRPKFGHSVTTEDSPVEGKTEDGVKEDMKLESKKNTSWEIVK